MLDSHRMGKLEMVFAKHTHVAPASYFCGGQRSAAQPKCAGLQRSDAVPNCAVLQRSDAVPNCAVFPKTDLAHWYSDA